MIKGSLRLVAVVFVALVGGTRLAAENYAVTTHVGTPNTSGAADGTPGSFRNPYGIAIDAAKNLYVSDTLNNTIRKITPARVVSTLAGTAGFFGLADGTGAAARFNVPLGLAVDVSGNVFVADAKNSVIRRITPAGVVTTYAGAPSQFGSVDGPAANARFFLPYGVAIDGDGNLYVADSGNHTIRKITAAGVVSTLAGAAMQSGFTDGAGSAARFNSPWSIAIDRSGVLHVSDNQNNAIRRITAAGVVSTLAGRASGATGSQDGSGAAARFDQPRGLTVDAAGNVFVMDYGNSTLRQITAAGVVSTPAGAVRIIGDTDSVGPAARFFDPTDVVADGSSLDVVDSSNNLIRKAVPASQAALPSISIQPASQEVSEGQAVTFRVTATGATAYRWLRNSGPIDGATAASFTIPAAQASDVGVYSVRVTGAGGSVDSEGASLLTMPSDYGAIRLTQRPASVNAAAGDAVTFTVVASGASLGYQWSKGGVDLAGATRASLSLPSVQGSDAGTYTVRITSGASAVTTSAKLQVFTAGPPSLTIVTQPSGSSLVAGQPLRLSVAATGSVELSYQWLRNDVAISGATSAVYSVAAVQASDAGTSRVRVSGGGLNELSSAATVTVGSANSGPTARLTNLSVRTAMASSQTLIVGVVVGGGGPRDSLVRAVGPTLGVFGLGNAMADPRLELYNGAERVIANDNWTANLAPTFSSVGAFALPVGSRDAAFLQSIDGARSIWAQGSGPGVVLVEAYDTGSTNSPRLVNMSARNQVGTGDDILIVGFNIGGTGTK
ncbi:MAG: immunoglobulin domain-containing protein, partial [Opitutaceae bacterium]